VLAKKKVQEVRDFLVAGTRRLLVLRGPPGSGKATALCSVCRDLGLEVLEWISTSRGQVSGAGGTVRPESLSAAFLRFLTQSNLRRVTLVRDFPFTLLESRVPAFGSGTNFNILEDFGSLVQSGAVQRAVFCFNDSREDHMAVTRMLAQVQPWTVASLQFDPVAQTFVRRALDGVARAEGGLVGTAAADSEVRQAMAVQCGGDLRHALNALQLVGGSWSTARSGCGPPREKVLAATGGRTRAAPRSTGRGRKALPPPTPQNASDTVVSQEEHCETVAGGGGDRGLRTASLGLFHALGRLLYNKRLPPPGFEGRASDPAMASQNPPKRRRRGDGVPQQLPHELLVPKAKRPPLYFEPEDVLAAACSEPQAVVEWLFTNAPRFYGDVGDLAEFAETLALADGWDRSAQFSHGGEIFSPPWDTLGSEIQARALLDANLHPVYPSFDDPCGSAQTSEAAALFKMVRPLLRDISRRRQSRLEKLNAILEVIGPCALGTATAGTSILTRTFPFVHLLLCFTGGNHPMLGCLPASLMEVVMELNTFDLAVLRSGKPTGDPADACRQAVRAAARSWLSPAVQPQDSVAKPWLRPLAEDPIESFD